MNCEYLCPYCWQMNEVELYVEDGEEQQMIIDCHVCCRPAVVVARWGMLSESFDITAEREAGE